MKPASKTGATVFLAVALVAFNGVAQLTSAQIVGGAGGAPWPVPAGRTAGGATSDYGYGYASVDGRGAYGGAGGNGGYYLSGMDDQGRRYAYSGGVGAGQPGAPGAPGAPGGYGYGGGYNGAPGYNGYPRNYYYSAAKTHYLHSAWITLVLLLSLRNF